MPPEPAPLPETQYTATLEQKWLLSKHAQCWHFIFAVDGVDTFPFEPGQFVSCVALDARGKQQVRAYSIASAPCANRFELCANRVEGGFFSNLLCDMAPGDRLAFNGPLGTFVVQQPPADTLLVATGTGVAPYRAFAQWLFPLDGEPRTHCNFHLVYGTRHETELYYADFFRELARRHSGFTYHVTLSRPTPEWPGGRGYVQDQAARLLAELPEGSASAMRAYLCGFRDMIRATRERLLSLGMEKRQIAYERYD